MNPPLDLDRLGLWPARVVWLIAPLTVGWAVRGALDEIGDGPGLTLEIGAWLFWFGVLVATLAPSTSSLTVARVGGPVAVVIAVLAWIGIGRFTAAVAVALGLAAVFTALLFLPTFGDRMINGSAYGSERRMALRPPAFMMVGPAQLAWLVACAGLLVGPVLLATGRTTAAVIAAGAGAVAVWAGGRVLHQLARRWIVFVPAGFVIHDPMGLVDSVLLRRNTIAALGPAVDTGSSGTDANGSDDGDDGDRTSNSTDNGSTGNDNGQNDHNDNGGRVDLSGGALGLALEVELKEPTPVTVRESRQARNTRASNLVFTPTLPGALLSEARIRGIKIGEATAPS